MANVISAVSLTTDKHFRHAGFSDTIIDSYSSPSGTPSGISWDGTHVISADSGAADKHYKHSGFSATITSSYTSPATTPTGMGWDGTHVISADFFADKHYKHSGFSATITTSYTSPNVYPTGISWDGTHVISADSNTNKHYKHSGFSATITSSYTSPSGNAYGITWDGTNVLSVDSVESKHYKHSGFSATITDSYSSPGTNPTGITWDEVAANTYDVALSISQVLTVAQATSQLTTTYTTIPIVRKRLRYIDSDIDATDIEQYIFEAEGIIDATMVNSMKDIFDAIKHDCIRACATDLAALQVLAYDPSVQPTIEAAIMTADLLYNSSQGALELISNPRNVKYWRSL